MSGATGEGSCWSPALSSPDQLHGPCAPACHVDWQGYPPAFYSLAISLLLFKVTREEKGGSKFRLVPQKFLGLRYFGKKIKSVLRWIIRLPVKRIVNQLHGGEKSSGVLWVEGGNNEWNPSDTLNWTSPQPSAHSDKLSRLRVWALMQRFTLVEHFHFNYTQTGLQEMSVSRVYCPWDFPSPLGRRIIIFFHQNQIFLICKACMILKWRHGSKEVVLQLTAAHWSGKYWWLRPVHHLIPPHVH